MLFETRLTRRQLHNTDILLCSHGYSEFVEIMTLCRMLSLLRRTLLQPVDSSVAASTSDPASTVRDANVSGGLSITVLKTDRFRVQTWLMLSRILLKHGQLAEFDKTLLP
jgi:hypothetical protein